MARITTEKDKNAADFLPLSEQAFQILAALYETDMHGYAIIKDVEKVSEGRTVLSASTLYSALKRMHRDGLIAELGEQSVGDGDERRRCYRISRLGRKVVEAEAWRLEQLTRTAATKKMLRRST